MEYDNIIKMVEAIDKIDFTIAEFNEFKNINQKIGDIYRQTLKNGKENARLHYQIVKDYLYTVIFKKLKEKLNFEDEVIVKIMYLIDTYDYINDIYILDGNAIVNYYNKTREKNEIIPMYNFININSKEFNKEQLHDSIKRQVVLSLNKALLFNLNNNYHNSLIIFDNEEIKYAIDNLNIYLNNDLETITMYCKNNVYSVTKILVNYNDELYYFDMRTDNGNIIISNNEYKIHKLSEISTNSQKIKKL